MVLSGNLLMIGLVLQPYETKDQLLDAAFIDADAAVSTTRVK
jgi:hypothetical protein